RLISMSLSFASSERAKVWFFKPSSRPSSEPVLSPSFEGPSVTQGQKKHPHHHSQSHRVKPYVVAPYPSESQACGLSCRDPLTETPFGSPCGCVFPMKVGLLLDTASLVVFPVVNELEIELASGTYLKHSQVRIMGVSADIQNQGRTVVDIDLVPLSEKFDNMTVVLISRRFWHKKIPLNRSLFGDYTLLYITYPGMPPFLPNGTSTVSGPLPSGNASGLLPFTANFIGGGKNKEMNLRTIIIIAVSSVLVLLGMVGIFYIIYKWTKTRRPSCDVGLPFTFSANKRSVVGPMLCSRMTSSTSVSHMSTMDTSALSVKTFSLSEIEKATDRFSSQRVLGEGGFGRVYHGRLNDGTDVAVKLLTRDIQQNGDSEFTVEVEMLCRLHHRNLVKLIGICTEGHMRCLVYELVRNGSVESHLHEGLERLVDPTLAGTYDFDEMAKVASIASLCVNLEVTHRPFMGEVVQALKLIFNDNDDVDYYSQKESSGQESDFRGDLSDSSAWYDEPEDITCHLAFRPTLASTFITMDYSSGPLEVLENRQFAGSTYMGDDMSLPIRLGNRSGPLRTARRSNLSFYRFTGNQSDHGVFPSKHVWDEGFWP
ncbi:hypothetical protein TSUD_29930, partial [Trifolium subterraneum]